jgi:hypothetical protein
MAAGADVGVEIVPGPARSRQAAAGRGAAGGGRAGGRQVGGRLAGRAMATAVGASHRLPCAAHPGVARRNSLRSLRELRSDSRRESEVRSALRAPTPGLRCSAPPTSPARQGARRPGARPPGPRRPRPALPPPPALETSAAPEAFALSEVPAAPEARVASVATSARMPVASTATHPAKARATRRGRARAQPRSIAGNPREAGASTQRAHGGWPAPLPAQAREREREPREKRSR